jgi:methylglyoxal synthase
MIALIAHNKKKSEMIEFSASMWNSSAPSGSSPHHTGKLLHDELGLDVERVAHGPEGGDLIIGGRVAKGKVQAIVFFRDPLAVLVGL